MRPILPALLVLALLTAASSPPSAGADDPEEDDPLAFVLQNDNVTLILERNVTFLGLGQPGAGNIVTLVPKDLYIALCYPCEVTRVPIYFTGIPEQCPIGPNPRSEQKVCIHDRPGPAFPLGIVEEADQALLVYGDGCIVNRAVDGQPPQRLTFENIAMPAATLSVGSIGCT